MIVKQDYAINADYNIGDLSTNHSFLLNGKPVGTNYTAGDGINISEDNVISVDPNALPEYTAGQGIAINDKEISIASGGVTTWHIANNSIGAGHIVNGAINGSKLSNSVVYIAERWGKAMGIYTPNGEWYGAAKINALRYSNNYQDATIIVKQTAGRDMASFRIPYELFTFNNSSGGTAYRHFLVEYVHDPNAVWSYVYPSIIPQTSVYPIKYNEDHWSITQARLSHIHVNLAYIGDYYGMPDYNSKILTQIDFTAGGTSVGANSVFTIRMSGFCIAQG